MSLLRQGSAFLRAGFIFAFALAFVSFIIGCDLGGNSGSETTNGLTGEVRNSEGMPIMGARVRLLAKDFDPTVDTALAETSSGAKGDYALSGMTPGRYNLEVFEAGRGHVALIRDLDIPPSGKVQADGSLSEPGKRVIRIADFTSSGDSGYLYSPGTGAIALIGAEAIARGEATLAQIPAGRSDSLVLVLLTGGQRNAITLERNIEMTPGVLTEAPPFASWAYSRKVSLDTKAMAISQDVFDFPLLVRLTPADSLFDQAESQGKDLRFTDAAHRPLAYQIERWDAASRQAEIWVRVDTVRANVDEQGIRLFWGQPEAGAAGEKSVFDPQAGFATVYHLGEAANAASGGYRDATPIGNHATAASLQPASQVNGVIGLARSFTGTPSASDGALTATVPQGLAGNNSFTVSFWLRCQIIPQRQTILDFGAYGLQQDMHFLLKPDTSIQFGAYDVNNTGATTAPWQSVIKIPQAPLRWMHMATVYDAVRASLEVYVDGSRADSLSVPAMAIDALGGLRIGKPIWNVGQPLAEYPYHGDLDEVRFESRALTPERIRLDYLTQKP